MGGGYFLWILLWHVANPMESFTAFIPINRCPLTCPWTPPVPSLIKSEQSQKFIHIVVQSVSC